MKRQKIGEELSKLSTIARVQITVEIEVGNFGKEETLEHIFKVAKQEALEKVNKIVIPGVVILRNTPTVMAILVPER